MEGEAIGIFRHSGCGKGDYLNMESRDTANIQRDSAREGTEWIYKLTVPIGGGRDHSEKVMIEAVRGECRRISLEVKEKNTGEALK